MARTELRPNLFAIHLLGVLADFGRLWPSRRPNPRSVSLISSRKYPGVVSQHAENPSGYLSVRFGVVSGRDGSACGSGHPLTASYWPRPCRLGDTVGQNRAGCATAGGAIATGRRATASKVNAQSGSEDAWVYVARAPPRNFARRRRGRDRARAFPPRPGSSPIPPRQPGGARRGREKSSATRGRGRTGSLGGIVLRRRRE